jgi:hypothetical protein
MKLFASALTVGLLALPLATWAEGPGSYIARGADYSGSVVLSQTGAGTWQASWNIDGDRYEGTGVGDGQTIALSFSGKSGSGTALYRANGTGGYDGIWAYRADRKTGKETWIPR